MPKYIIQLRLYFDYEFIRFFSKQSLKVKDFTPVADNNKLGLILAL